MSVRLRYQKEKPLKHCFLESAENRTLLTRRPLFLSDRLRAHGRAQNPGVSNRAEPSKIEHAQARIDKFDTVAV